MSVVLFALTEAAVHLALFFLAVTESRLPAVSYQQTVRSVVLFTLADRVSDFGFPH
jgi:hypothetical protein